MRKTTRFLIEKLVEIRDRFDGERERAQTLAADLVRTKVQLARLKEDIDDLMAGIDAIEKLT